jgi:2-oxoglutarate dehydrogenase E2 component (dihydrolipoamide succinyltransferase)
MIEIKVPSPGESVTTVTLASWLVSDGDFVEKNQEIAEIDSDKATLSISAAESGVISIVVEAGESVGVGAVIGTIEAGEGAPVVKSASPGEVISKGSAENREEKVSAVPENKEGVRESSKDLHLSPLAKAYMQAEGLTEGDVMEMLKNRRIRKSDLETLVGVEGNQGSTSGLVAAATERVERREKMTPLRLKLSQRLVGVKNETAMLTTFNEVDMSEVLKVRAEYGKAFEEKHGVKLGLMAFFTRAAAIALNEFPQVNAFIDQDEIVFHEYVDISIAVSAPRGLVVPVVRNAHLLSLAGAEQDIRRLAEKARNNKLTLDEMTGGTFTITNGGVFGSMLSTPIINPPQSAILGMHNIVERPVAISGKVEIRPIMYVALSYDHRIIDGRESVGFLVRVKELIENPVRMAMQRDPYSAMLEL